MEQERIEYAQRLQEKDQELDELRARVSELQQEKLREAREIERIKIEQERLDTQYRDIEESLGR